MPTTKRLSLNEIRARLAKFAVDYKSVKTEKQHTSDFWKALMRCYGVEDSYLHGVTFEYPAFRSDTGGQGYIDVFMPGQYLIEQKTDGKIIKAKGAAESNAENQAKAYLTGGTITKQQMPRWVVTSDFTSIQITDLSASRNSPVRTTTFATADLAEHVEALLFLTGEGDALIAEEQAEASKEAAALMGDLYAALTGDDDTPADNVIDPEDEDLSTMEASILLTRLLFLMFGDDADLWPRGLFHDFVLNRTAADGSDLGQQLTALFHVLDTPEQKRDKRTDEAFLQFPHVNGALFDMASTKMLWFDTAMRDALLAACQFDWSRISPAVFGSLFQTVKSKKDRGSDGEHYTSEANILKTIGPMFLDDFRTRLDAANTKPQLEALHNEFRNLRYVDPACGCGNFLIVAYREMRALELDLLVKLRAKTGRENELMMDPSDLLHVRLDQFYGIEINWWPAKIAETAMFLIDHQANRQMQKRLGFTPNRLPIEIAASIRHANALTTDWALLLPAPGPRIFMFGNPPFLGRKERSKEQGQQLAEVWGVKSAGHLDFVTAWFIKAAQFLKERDGEFALVATNSITQGEPVARLFDGLADLGWRIRFAHRSFQWTNDSASKERAIVHVVIIGFTKDAQAKQRLFAYETLKSAPHEVPVKRTVNAYAVDGPNHIARRRSSPLSPSLPAIEYGSMPNDGGHLLINPADYEDVMADAVAAKYVRKFVGAKELVQDTERWCLWLTDLVPSDVAKSPVLRERLAAVRKTRLESTNPDTWPHAETPHLFWFRNQPTVPYLCVPSTVSENRPYFPTARFGPDVITSNAANVCPDSEGFVFALISSKMFLTWQQTVGGRLKSDLRFSNTLVWNNFPAPKVDQATRTLIISAGKKVLGARALHPSRSLAEHYTEFVMDADLLAAHRDLDKMVDKAFGCAKRNPAFGDRQSVLFERFAELLPAD
ncbi:class I SAM-dependent DNA methyltransferase [Aeromicrobium sp. CF4.19]|uniref:class I SAM-dependent DNA methyltransferase n=1 Tax=Aeromicrobium sp. CF4.19 TaxID=3373082 RepID=UPI003EE5EFB1